MNLELWSFCVACVLKFLRTAPAAAGGGLAKQVLRSYR